VILLDDVQFPVDRPELNRAKTAAKMLVDRLGPGDLAAVVFIRLRQASQDFTSDHAKLKTAIDGFLPSRPPRVDKVYSDFLRGLSFDGLGAAATNLAAFPGRRKALFYFGTGVEMPETNPPSLAFEQLKQVFRDAQRANVNIYPIDPGGLEGPKDFDVMPEPSRTITAATEWYQTVAENTGGVAIVNRNDFDTATPRILDENGTYYLIGYESPNLKTDGLFRKIDVKVNRPRVTVRARSGYYGTKADATEKSAAGPKTPSSEIETAVGSLLSNAVVRMQVTAAAFAVAEKPGAALAIALGVRPEALEDLSQMDDVKLVAAAFTVDGKMAAAWVQPFRMGAGLKQYELLTRLDLKPGRYQLRVSAESKLRGKTGSVFTDVEVPDFSKPLSFSGVVVHAEPGVKAPPNVDVTALVPLAPTTVRDFAGNQQVTAFLKVYQGGKGKLADVPLSVRIRDVHDAVVFEAPQSLTAERFDSNRAAEYRLALPIDKLAPGPYLLTIETVLKKGTLRRDVRFQVH
jgi:VWFA-related protein